MIRIALPLQMATPANFAPFGKLLQPKTPHFTCAGFDWYENLAQIPLHNVELGVVTAKYTGDFRQASLERHIASEEIIVPMKEDVLLVLGTTDALDSPPDPSRFRALYVRAGQIAVLSKGTWHEGPKTFARKAPCLVLYNAGTGQNDKEVLHMEDLGLEISVTEFSNGSP